MEYKINYCQGNSLTNPFHGNHGKMTVRNSTEGVLVTHEEELYSSEHWSLGDKIVKDICNSLRNTYDPYLVAHCGEDDKREFKRFLDSEIERAESRLNELKFAKTILSRKKVIFKKVEFVG